MGLLALAFEDNAFKDSGIKKPEEIFSLTVPDFKEFPTCVLAIRGGRQMAFRILFLLE